MLQRHQQIITAQITQIESATFEVEADPAVDHVGTLLSRWALQGINAYNPSSPEQAFGKMHAYEKDGDRFIYFYVTERLQGLLTASYPPIFSTFEQHQKIAHPSRIEIIEQDIGARWVDFTPIGKAIFDFTPQYWKDTLQWIKYYQPQPT